MKDPKCQFIRLRAIVVRRVISLYERSHLCHNLPRLTTKLNYSNQLIIWSCHVNTKITHVSPSHRSNSKLVQMKQQKNKYICTRFHPSILLPDISWGRMNRCNPSISIESFHSSQKQMLVFGYFCQIVDCSKLVNCMMCTTWGFGLDSNCNGCNFSMSSPHNPRRFRKDQFDILYPLSFSSHKRSVINVSLSGESNETKMRVSINDTTQRKQFL
jgi:hypothetical protein